MDSLSVINYNLVITW